MPRKSARQKAIDDLQQAWIDTMLEEGRAEAYYSSSDESSSASAISSDDDADLDPPAGQIYLDALTEILSTRYYQECRSVEKTTENLRLLLTVYKYDDPDLFRSHMRISPACFDDLLGIIQDDPVFSNNSQNEQLPVVEQLAIALHRFGHFGNSESVLKVSLWAGVGVGTVVISTKRVMKAVCRDHFRQTLMQWPDDQTKEIAKHFVEERSCSAWRGGWLMVDGTLVPLYQRPAYFGNTWFDRKSNYSMNVQLICTPDCRIRDYGVGLPGSQHDATAWQETRIPKGRDGLLAPNEWVWADTAYPLQTWCQSPYKKPEKDIRENSTYNYYVSRIRIVSEHCVGFLKGRFSSLRGLRIQIADAKQVQFASLWITACILLHSFAMDHEFGIDMSKDVFFIEGQHIMAEERTEREARRREQEQYQTEWDNRGGAGRERELELAREKREQLKMSLFEALY